jgi:hypothetical protein
MASCMGLARATDRRDAMTIEETTRHSRRALLTAAAGAAGAIAASAAVPATMRAADPDDVVKGIDNATIATTTITDSGADSTAFAGHATGTGYGYGVEGTSAAAAGIFGWSVSAPAWDPPFEPGFTANTGVFGTAAAGDHETTYGSGVWGDSPDAGVYGTGSVGVEGYGGWAVAGFANSTANSVGVFAAGGTASSSLALRAEGRVHFSRSGKKSIGSGKSSIVVYLTGVTSSSMVFAVLRTSESGRWVRAVVAASGKFTVYLNTKLASSASLSWFVLD